MEAGKHRIRIKDPNSAKHSHNRYVSILTKLSRKFFLQGSNLSSVDKTEVHWVPLASDWGGKVDKKRKHIDPRYGFDLFTFFHIKPILKT